MDVYGVILAGGGGLRLGGVEKSRLRLAGDSLVSLVHRQLIGQAKCVSITCAPEHYKTALPDSIFRLTDPFSPQIGPLGGIFAGYKWAKSLGASDQDDCLLIAPVDTPEFPSNFAQFAIESLGSADVVVARFSDQEYPTCSLWRCKAASLIASTRSSASNNSVRGYLDNLNVVYIDFEAYFSQNPFKNVNKISDLIELDCSNA